VLIRPELVGSLVLVSASPGLDERSRRLRRTADEGLADRIERIGVERFITEWLANPLVGTDHIPQHQRDADRAMRLENTAEGLAAALRGMGQASVGDAGDRIATLPMPIDFVAGTDDEKYVALATAMAASRSQRPVLVEGAGHNVILDAPQAVAAVISRRLA
jgi:pimeloyl-ACP methyl ester carboxylesterase